jgi:hypothetical protein
MIQNKWLNANWHLIFLAQIFCISLLFGYNLIQSILYGVY